MRSENATRTRQLLAQQIDEQSSLGKSLIQLRGPLVRGYIHVRYAQCRKGNCKCTKGKPHGPFLYASLKMGRRTVYRYVGKPNDAALVRKIKNYQEFRAKLAKLRRLGRTIHSHWGKFEQDLLERLKR